MCIFRHPGPIVCVGVWIVRDTITQHHVFPISSSTITMRGILKWKLGVEGNPITVFKSGMQIQCINLSWGNVFFSFLCITTHNYISIFSPYPHLFSLTNSNNRAKFVVSVFLNSNFQLQTVRFLAILLNHFFYQSYNYKCYISLSVHSSSERGTKLTNF